MRKCSLCLQPVTEEQEPHAQLVLIAADLKRGHQKVRHYGHPDCVEFFLGSRPEVRKRSTVQLESEYR